MVLGTNPILTEPFCLRIFVGTVWMVCSLNTSAMTELGDGSSLRTDGGRTMLSLLGGMTALMIIAAVLAA